MPFGLKNAGATYQCAMITIFRGHLRKTIECYVDIIIVNSHSESNHLDDLRTVFDIMRAHQLEDEPDQFIMGSVEWQIL